MGTTYATAAEVKSKNSAIELTHSDAEILELVEAASRYIDYEAEVAEGFYGDGVPPIIKAATILVALAYFQFQSSAGKSAERVGDRNYTVEKPEDLKRRVRLLLDVHNPPSLI